MAELDTRRRVPYYAQWESRDLVGAIIAGTASARDDARWERSGARSLEEYEYWSWRCCGMACLNMALDYWCGFTRPTVELAKECQAAGGYVARDGQLIGLIYEPFCAYVKDRFGLVADTHTGLSTGDIHAAIASGCLVMASVHPDIRWPAGAAPGRGGHLVLVVGAHDQALYLNNPSGIAASQEYARVETADFERFFAGRGVVLHPPVGGGAPR
ncbi:C39 family peptidase [Streptomyces melanogenes]|uniref:C39 family peptidase n=1 Tax=Streptomyces melanogenes TaxID=67326 RepID=UPI00379640A4